MDVQHISRSMPTVRAAYVVVWSLLHFEIQIWFTVTDIRNLSALSPRQSHTIPVQTGIEKDPNTTYISFIILKKGYFLYFLYFSNKCVYIKYIPFCTQFLCWYALVWFDKINFTHILQFYVIGTESNIITPVPVKQHWQVRWKHLMTPKELRL